MLPVAPWAGVGVSRNTWFAQLWSAGTLMLARTTSAAPWVIEASGDGPMATYQTGPPTKRANVRTYLSLCFAVVNSVLEVKTEIKVAKPTAARNGKHQTVMKNGVKKRPSK